MNLNIFNNIYLYLIKTALLIGFLFSQETLIALYKHSSNESYIYRHKWTAGDLVVWDNRCVLHYAEHGYGDKKRTMHRITTAGSKPF